MEGPCESGGFGIRAPKSEGMGSLRLEALAWGFLGNTNRETVDFPLRKNPKLHFGESKGKLRVSEDNID